MRLVDLLTRRPSAELGSMLSTSNDSLDQLGFQNAVSLDGFKVLEPAVHQTSNSCTLARLLSLGKTAKSSSSVQTTMQATDCSRSPSVVHASQLAQLLQRQNISACPRWKMGVTRPSRGDLFAVDECSVQTIQISQDKMLNAGLDGVEWSDCVTRRHSLVSSDSSESDLEHPAMMSMNSAADSDSYESLPSPSQVPLSSWLLEDPVLDGEPECCWQTPLLDDNEQFSIHNFPLFNLDEVETVLDSGDDALSQFNTTRTTASSMTEYNKHAAVPTDSLDGCLVETPSYINLSPYNSNSYSANSCPSNGCFVSNDSSYYCSYPGQRWSAETVEINNQIPSPTNRYPTVYAPPDNSQSEVLKLLLKRRPNIAPTTFNYNHAQVPKPAISNRRQSNTVRPPQPLRVVNRKTRDKPTTVTPTRQDHLHRPQFDIYKSEEPYEADSDVLDSLLSDIMLQENYDKNYCRSFYTGSIGGGDNYNNYCSDLYQETRTDEGSAFQMMGDGFQTTPNAQDNLLGMNKIVESCGKSQTLVALLTAVACGTDSHRSKTTNENYGLDSLYKSSDDDVFAASPTDGRHSQKVDKKISIRIATIDHDYCRTDANNLNSMITTENIFKHIRKCENTAIRNLLLDTNLTEEVRHQAKIDRAISMRKMSAQYSPVHVEDPLPRSSDVGSLLSFVDGRMDSTADDVIDAFGMDVVETNDVVLEDHRIPNDEPNICFYFDNPHGANISSDLLDNDEPFDRVDQNNSDNLTFNADDGTESATTETATFASDDNDSLAQMDSILSLEPRSVESEREHLFVDNDVYDAGVQYFDSLAEYVDQNRNNSETYEPQLMLDFEVSSSINKTGRKHARYAEVLKRRSTPRRKNFFKCRYMPRWNLLKRNRKGQQMLTAVPDHSPRISHSKKNCYVRKSIKHVDSSVNCE